MGTHRFDVLSGAGVDDAGHVTISTRSRAGSLIRRFSPDGKTMLWQRYTAQFMNRTVFGPAYDGTVVFGGHGGYNRFVLDYQRTDRLDTWVAITSDPFRFPHDYRWHRTDAVRFPNGKLYLVSDAMHQGTLILRPEANSEIFIPSVFLSAMGRGTDYPPHRPIDPERPTHPYSRRVMWRDLNGDGHFQPEEYVVIEPPQNQTSWFVDSKGNFWEFREEYKRQRQDPPGFLRYPLKGFDKYDNPIYDFPIRNAEHFSLPAPFAARTRYEGDLVVQRFYYDAEHDRMFIAGYPADYAGPRGGAGAALARYDNFTDPQKRHLVSLIDLPIDPKRQYYHIQSVAMVGDLAFAGLGRAVAQEASVLVFNTRTGEYLGAMFPGAKLWGETNLLDIHWALNAFARQNGEIIVTCENNWKNLQVVYRIPPQPLVPKTAPTGWKEKKPMQLEAIDPGLR